MKAQTTAVYVRVSTRRQDLASQEPDLKRWVESRPEGTQVRWYHDKFTGKTTDRPGFSKLEADIASGKVTTVVVWRLDRLGRTAKGLVALFDQWSKQSVNLVSMREGIDLATPAGRLMANVLASVAAYETEVRQERVLAGLEVAKEKGVKLGRPVGTGKAIKVTPEQEKQVRRLKDEGTPVAAIARSTGLSRPTVYSILARAGVE